MSTKLPGLYSKNGIKKYFYTIEATGTLLEEHRFGGPPVLRLSHADQRGEVHPHPEQQLCHNQAFNGKTEEKQLQVIGFQHPGDNHFLAIKELKIHGDRYRRRTDIVGFVNGVPLVVCGFEKEHRGSVERLH